MSNIVKLLGNGRWILRSHYMNAKIAIVLNIAFYKSVKGRVLIIDWENNLTPIIERIEVRGKPENILITGETPRDMGDAENILVLEPRKTPLDIHNRNILITTTPGRKIWIPRIYRKAYITRYDEEYKLRTGEEEYRFRLNGINIIEIDKPPGRLGEAYSLLRESILEYGELRVRDVVFILSKNLGISRDEARRILSELTRRKYIGVRKGIVEIW